MHLAHPATAEETTLEIGPEGLGVLVALPRFRRSGVEAVADAVDRVEMTRHRRVPLDLGAQA